MRLVLSETEQALMTATARTLLSPFDSPLDRWRADVLQHVTKLLGADVGAFMLAAGEGTPYTLRHLPDDFAREFIETYHAIDESAPMIRAIGGGVWSTRMLAEIAGAQESWKDVRSSPVYHEFYCRYELRDAIGFAVVPGAPSPGRHVGPPVAHRGALLTCFRKTFGTDAFGDRGLAMLRMLEPALEAGVTGRIRNHWMRSALEVGFDASRDGLLVCDPEGRRLYANAALEDMLRADPEAARIKAGMDHVKRLPQQLLRSPDGAEGLADMHAASTEMRTSRAGYRIRGHLTGEDLFGMGSAVVVSVEQLTPEIPSLGQLHERWRLTGQEARVALLLAQGKTNARIATTLNLRPSTARHYTESVFSKMGTNSRAEVAYKILSH